MKKPLLIPAMVVFVAGMILGACAAPSPVPSQPAAPAPTPAPTQPIELTIALGSPPGHTNTVTWERWAKEVEEATKGRVKFKTFIGGALLKEPEICDGILKGIADAGNFLPAFTPGRFNVLEAFELPGLGPSSGTSSSMAMWEAFKTIKPAEYKDFKMLWCASPGSAHIGTVKKPVRNLADIKGMEIRGSGITKNALDALGAVGVAIPMPETPIALQKGIVDGVAHTLETIVTEKFGDYFKWNTICYVYSAFRFHAGMNLQKWNSLPPDIQKIIDDISDGYAKKHGEQMDINHEKGWKFMQDNKIEVIRLAPDEYERWVKAWEPVRNKWVADMKAKGLPAEDYVKLATDLLAKYYKQYPDPIAKYMK